MIDLFYAHGANILRRKKNWGFSVVVFVIFFTVTVFLLWQYRLDAKTSALSREAEPALRA